MQHDVLADVQFLDHHNDAGLSTTVLDTRNILDGPEPAMLPLEQLMGSSLLAVGKHLDLQLAYCGHEPGLHDISALLVFRKVSYRIDPVFFSLSPSFVPCSLSQINILGHLVAFLSCKRALYSFCSLWTPTLPVDLFSRSSMDKVIMGAVVGLISGLQRWATSADTCMVRLGHLGRRRDILYRTYAYPLPR